MKPVSSSGRSGFSIAEGITYLIVFGLLMGALTYGMAALFTSQAQPVVTYNQAIYSQAPSFDNFHQAIDLHSAFSNAVDQADNIVVLGGVRTHPALDPTGPSSALDFSFADSTLISAIDGTKAFSSWAQRVVNDSQFNAYLTNNPDPADFTILTVRGLSRITSVTQQRRHLATINGRDLALYEVTHTSVDWSSGAPVWVPNSVTGSGPTYFYRFYYAAAEDSWSMRPGATHYWYRSDSAWNREQEGPSRIVFADPYTLAGQDSGAPTMPLSRFVYFLPQLR